MDQVLNPFEYDAAPNLDPRVLVDWFIEDHNYSRFIQSSRNVLINGQRGSGKSMALIYNSMPYLALRHEIKQEDFPPRYAGIYVPCNTPLTHKDEYRLLPDVEQAILSEHFLVYGIATAVAKDMGKVSQHFGDEDLKMLVAEFSYLLGVEPKGESDPFVFLQRAVHAKLKDDQQKIAQGRDVSLEFDTNTFYSLILPLISALRKTKLLERTHISLLIDDAHDLNPHQKRVLNSWLGYRDHSLFSFKVAIAGVRHYDLHTAFSGTILEGHDFITIDFEQPFQNQESTFGKFAREVVAKRLSNAGISKSPDDFFPESLAFLEDLRDCERLAEQMALDSGISPENTKAIGDFRYKYARALYFRKRSSKANKPLYAGFDTLVHLSTGVIRNLLDPCYWMFERVISEGTAAVPAEVPPSVQSEIIHSRSSSLWAFVREKLDTQVEGCGKSEAEQLSNLFAGLAEYFRHRLLHHKSEPRVIAFSISGYDREIKSRLDPLFRLAQTAQLLYVRRGPAKDGGGREDYYTPNRLLWPEYGLDVHGQHGRASLKAKDLLEAVAGKSIPAADSDDSPAAQRQLFNE